MPRHSLTPLSLLLLVLILNACAPLSPTPTPKQVTAVPSLTAVATSQIHPTNTFQPTLTSTLPPTPQPPYRGALDAEQRDLLNRVAQQYISLTPEEAQTTAIALDFIGRNANPATICGPLSLAILQQAGLVDQSIDLADFWYLDPRPGHDERLLQVVFPADRFEKIEQDLPLNQVDFTRDPLYPGDFLYLFAGDSGSFEHMIVVSRVDDTGKAYAVTNLNTQEGVIISEVMLYDPDEPGVGQFYEWTDWVNRYIGRTGYGGYWLWRPIPPAP